MKKEWRKLMCVMLSFVLVLSIGNFMVSSVDLVVSAESSEDKNLIANGGFENDTQGWTVESASSKWYIDSSNKYEGEKAFGLKDWQSKGIYTNVLLEKDQKYTLSFYKYNNGGTVKVIIGDTVVISEKLTQNSQWVWQEFTFSFTAPSTGSAVIRFNTENGGYAVFDNVSLVETSTELIKNGGFENDTEGWTLLSSSSNYYIDSSNKYEGEKALTLKNWQSGAYTEVSLEKGLKYELSLYKYNKGGTVRITLGDTEVLSEKLTQNSQWVWQNFTFTFTAPSSAMARIYLTTKEGAGYAVYDNISLKVIEETVVPDYENNGEKITINNDCELNLNNINHTKKSGFAFIGWKNSLSGEYTSDIVNCKAGDILIADYVEYNNDSTEDFGLEEMIVKNQNTIGIRYIFNQNKEFVNSLPNVIETGAILLPTDSAMAADMFLDTPVVYTWKWDSSTLSDFTPNSVGPTPTTVKFVNVFEEDYENIKYTVLLKDIEEEKYDTFYSARGYIKFLDKNGIEQIIYTTQKQTSLYKLSAEEKDKTLVENNIVNLVKESVNNDRLDYYSNRTLTYGSGKEDTKGNYQYNIYSYNDYSFREVTLNTGISGVEETDIFFFSDPHFNYINEKDIEDARETALSSYRGRSWSRSTFVKKGISLMNFAQMFDYTVIGGDIMDYTTYGSSNAAGRMIGLKSVNNNIMMLLGNHDGTEKCEPDKSNLADILTKDERYSICQTNWTNDVFYTSKILKKQSGEDNIMLIGLDNGTVAYRESQIEPLTADLAYARKNNIPVIIFQHIPMLTMNENETEYKFIKGAGTSYGFYFGDDVNYPTNSVQNMTKSTRYVGGAPWTDEATREVCKIIRQNYDIIEGVFTGHEHAHMYTEIVGLDANGNPVDEIIPQHTVFGAHYQGAMTIKVK